MINLRKIFFKPGLYELKLKSFHEIGWTYFVAGEFRKDKWFESKNILSKELCNTLIKENKDLVIHEDVERVVDGILHKRIWNKVDLKYNSEFEQVLNKTLFSGFKPVDIKNIRCWFVSYKENELYDRRVETIKGLPLNDLVSIVIKHYCDAIQRPTNLGNLGNLSLKNQRFLFP